MHGSRLAFLSLLAAVPAAFGSGSGPAPSVPPAVPHEAVRQDRILDVPSPLDAALHDPAHARPLPFLYDLYTFRGQGGSTAVVAAFAVAAGGLQAESSEAGARFRFDVTLVLVDTVLRSVWRTGDSVYVEFPRAPAGDHLLFTQVEVLAPPSRGTHHRVIMTDATTAGVGQLYSGSFPIPDYRGNRLMVSDIALGRAGAPGGWKRGELTLALLPGDRVPTSAFDVYYEIYNLPAGHEYTTEIAVERLAGEGVAADRGPVRLRFKAGSAPGRDGAVAELRHVDSALASGSYRITVTIRDEESGATASRSRTFEVRGWARGATMVPALPHRPGNAAAPAG